MRTNNIFVNKLFNKNKKIGKNIYMIVIFQDTLLDFDPADLKDLLKECGLRPGELLEIKRYLANRG